jgi:exodeoxyribonuclease III
VLNVLTINLGAAARPRAETLLEWLAGRHEEVFLLTETSDGPGTSYIVKQLRIAGFHVEKSSAPTKDRGVVIASKVPIIESLSPHMATVSLPGRVAFASLATEPTLNVLAVYVPSRDRSIDKTERKEEFLSTLTSSLARLPERLRASMLLGGDYNVIARHHKPLYPGFLPFEFQFLASLEEFGFADCFETCYPGKQAYSWIGRTGDGYRYDYIHAGKELRDRILNSAYLHETRTLRLTDHAAHTASIDVTAPTILETSDPTVISDQPEALF